MSLPALLRASSALPDPRRHAHRSMSRQALRTFASQNGASVLAGVPGFASECAAVWGITFPTPPSRPVLALNTRCAARDAREVSLAIMGDLHLEPAQMPLFHAARRQIRTSLRSGAGEDLADGLMPCGARVVQLGDLGGYTNAPGSRRVPSGPRRAALTISQTVSPNQDKAYPLPHVPVAHPACRSTSQTRLTAVHVVPLLYC